MSEGSTEQPSTTRAASGRQAAECVAALERHLQPRFFKALCDPRRLALLVRIAAAGQPQTVTQASSCCGVHISGVSRHLAMLREAGVVAAERRGREVVYRIDVAGVASTLRGLADALEDCAQSCGCCARTDGACDDQS